VSDLLRTIGLPEIVAAIMVLALNAYVLMGGAIEVVISSRCSARLGLAACRTA